MATLSLNKTMVNNGAIFYFEETKKFYLALNAVGTDFSLMVKLFPGRSRAELKRKWQKEEKTSRHLLDKAISNI